MKSPLYSSVGGADDLNGGFSANAACATMKPNLRNGRPNVPLAMDRNYQQRSEMMNTYD